MPTAEDALNVARSQLGVTESPLRSNRQPYGDWYVDEVKRGGEAFRATAWCDQFASWCGWKAGAEEVFGIFAYTPSHANWFKAKDQWGATPVVGALAFYNIGGLRRISHVGIVEHVYPDGSWVAIEGNTDEAGGRTGGKVMRQHRSRLGAGGGFGYPAYDGVPTGVVATPVTGPVAQPQNDDLVEDGELGPMTISRWQTVMGTPVDGKIDRGRSLLVVAVQRLLNAKGYRPQLSVDGVGIRQDGNRYKTVDALQWYLGTPRDGVMSVPRSEVVKAIQRRLNHTGTF